MTPDLHKRLDDAAEIKAGCPCPEKSECCKELCVKYNYALGCMKYGYKEAIEVAKEWLLNNVKNYLGTLYADAVFGSGLLDDFETDMNKFLEEKK